ncbi:hypothetical protein Ancab_015149, partial [Ancistrocladus abbreviatus]
KYVKKYLEDILNLGSCHKKGKSAQCPPKYETHLQTKVSENLKISQTHSESDSGVEVHDSQIINMNRILCKSSSPGKAAQLLTPHQNWDFIEHIGVRDKKNLEDVICQIGDMEQWDWELFQQIASQDKQKALDKVVSIPK